MTTDPSSLHPETLAIIGGRTAGETSLAPVIYPTSAFEADPSAWT